MASRVALFARARARIQAHSIRSITTSTVLSQEPQLAEHVTPTPLPPNPSTGSPLYSSKWRSPISAAANGVAPSLTPLGLSQPSPRIIGLAKSLDLKSILDVFADWMTSQRWDDIKQLFELWVRSLDKNGKPNKPDVDLYNHYLRANLMSGASVGELLDLITQMEEFAVVPNTASFNLVLKAMYQANETVAAEKLLERMLQSGKESLPNEESYDLVVGLLFKTDQIDSALKYIDLTLRSGYMLSMKAFSDCVGNCVNQGRLDMLVSVIERCKTMDQNKSLSPSWNMCNFIAEAALKEENSKLAFYALEFMAKWIARGEIARPPVFLSVDEGLVVSALTTAGRTHNSTLLDASWAILRRSLRQTKAPNPESYIAKICALASMGNLQRAFGTLNEFETAYVNSDKEVFEELFSPFTSLHPLVVACSKKGFESLDLVYFQLENLSRNDPPYKSVAALNCIILGCANTWDLDRAYQTFEAISSVFGLVPNVHSYNALMCAFGKAKKTLEAKRVFEHMVGLAVKPNATSYSLLADAHLIKRDQKAALAAIDDMVGAGFTPSREILKKVRRRCIREMDYESDDKVDSLAKNFKIRLGSENRRDTLFKLDYSTEFA